MAEVCAFFICVLGVLICPLTRVLTKKERVNMDVPLALYHTGILHGLMVKKRKSSTFCYLVDVVGLPALSRSP